MQQPPPPSALQPKLSRGSMGNGSTRLTRVSLTHSHFFQRSAPVPRRSQPSHHSKLPTPSPSILATSSLSARPRGISLSLRPRSSHPLYFSTISRSQKALRTALRTCPARSFNPAIRARFEPPGRAFTSKATNMDENKWTGLKVRQTFFDFFHERGHTVGKHFLSSFGTLKLGPESGP